MKYTTRIILIFSTFLLIYNGIVLAQNESVITPAGKFEIKAKDASNNCLVLLANKTIKSFECEYSYTPIILAHFSGNIGKMSDVIVLQEIPMGNACNGGPLYILSIQKNGSYQISEPIDFCGGKDPIVSKKNGVIIITFPGGQPNRGSDYIPTETWEYSDGEIKKVPEKP